MPTTLPFTRRVQHRPALDGLRGLAIAAVMAFHLPATRRWAPGGYVGVDLFFVLSGFLITAPLLGAGSPGTLRLRTFYRRRARRLLPALVTFLVVWEVARLMLGHYRWFWADPFASVAGSVVPVHLTLRGGGLALVYAFNWARARHWALPPLGHLWSLSVEGQFYLCWPPLVVLVIRRWRRAILPCTLVLAGLSSALPLVLWRHGRGADRIYFGSDTRAQALLAGALLAELWATGTLERWLGRRRRAALAGVGAVVLASLILRPHDGAFKYGGAFTMASLAGGVVVGYLVDEPGNWASRALSSRPLRWLGERSYGLYLWHWVLLCWTCHLPSVVAPVVAVGGAGVVAEASWRVVERPVMRGAGKRPSRPPPERAGAPPVAASVTAELANAG